MSAASGNGLDDEPSYRWPIPPPEGWTATSTGFRASRRTRS